MMYIWALLIGYFLGSINFAVLVAKYKGLDLFSLGSGNPGATNVKRTMGAFWGNTVFLLDFSKGYLAVFLTQSILVLEGLNYDLLGVSGLLGAILGHSFSIFIKFRGGKGVATTMGGFLALMPWVLVLGLVAWLIVFFSTRVVAMASIVFAISLPISFYFLHDLPDVRWIFCIVLATLIVVRHYSNIQRLLSGKEHDFSKK
jgi:glycerol-3-phosphate acyltransferase PlsY